MANTPYWVDGRDANAGLWDFVWLGDSLLPGILVPGSMKVDHKVSLDIGQAQGASGAPVKVKGRQPRSISFQIRSTKAEQWEAWDDVLKALNIFGADANAKPFQITHPLCAKFGIATVYIESVSMPSPDAVNGGTFSFSCVENIPAKSVSQSKTPQKKAQAGNPRPDFGAVGFDPPSNNLA